MKLKRYRYSGPQSAASLRVGKSGELLDVQLQPGQPVDLPADHEYTLVLLALKHLEPLADEPAPTEKKGDKA
ncbi:hypothetical protein [Pseudomonas sp. TMP9]|uniref:hypothetical protein n=1 Tax=Pseudomonas sp. TMP9 TaxID=3133144 RepID=UPI0030CA77B4